MGDIISRATAPSKSSPDPFRIIAGLVDKSSLLVHASAEAGCTAVLTEDLAGDTTFAGARVINPFPAAAPSSAAEAILKVY